MPVKHTECRREAFIIEQRTITNSVIIAVGMSLIIIGRFFSIFAEFLADLKYF